MNVFRCLYNVSLFCIFVFSSSVWAAEPVAATTPKSLCAVAHAEDANGTGAMLFQYAFEGGAHDLAMILSNQPSSGNADVDVKRVTFGGSLDPICHYKTMALARGGDWGWHLAWVAKSAAILSYTRMDSVAWVSSPIKKLSKNAHIVGQPVILTSEQKIWIVWVEADGSLNKIYAVYSDDEGRSWLEAKLLTQTSTVLGKLFLDVREHKPYLVWGGKAEATPLLD